MTSISETLATIWLPCKRLWWV